MLDKESLIAQLERDGNALQEFLWQLSDQQKNTDLGEGWTVKDVVAHLAAWNEETVAEIGRILEDQATWQKFYEAKEGEDEFNRREVEKRKGLPYKDVFSEWKDSYQTLLDRVRALTSKQWEHQSGTDTWQIGRFKGVPISVQSLLITER